MRRGPKPAKSKEAKPPVAPKSPRNDAARVRDLEQRLAEALRDKAEAQEQQTATAEILRVIGASPTDVQPVFDAIASSAARLCSTYDVFIRRLEGNGLRLVAHYGPIPASALIPVMRGSVSGRAVLERRTVHVVDVQGAADEFPDGATLGREFGVRTNLGVPLLREGVPLGAIVMRRTETKPFTDEEIALLQTFADQAVIAIENVRLFNETKEALEQRTATSEILRVISNSPTDVQPVFDAMAESAARLCDAFDALIFRVDTDVLRIVAHHGPIPAYPVGQGPSLARESLLGRAVLDRRTIHVADMQAEVDEYPIGSANARRFGHRTALVVPLLRSDEAIGVIAVRRTEVRPFADRQVALIRTFADQAVIAIENVRLFTELEEKNRALTQAHAQATESLEQQTATSEILRAISQSPTDVQPVFDTIVRNAVRLCGALYGTVTRTEGDLIHLAAQHNLTPNQADALRRAYPASLSSEAPVPRSMRAGTVYRVRDVEAAPDWQSRTEEMRTALRSRGVRSHLAVPMLRQGIAIGAINLTHREVGAFSDTHVELVKTFADQAVIAIENVRLFKELESRNRDLTATSEILQVISRSPTDTQPVFDMIADNAVKLFRPWSVAVYRYDGEFMHVAAVRGGRPGSEQYLQSGRPPTRDVMAGRCIIDRTVIHVPDFETDPDIPLAAREIARARGFGATINVPMLRDGEPIGVISVSRAETGPFLQAEIEVLRTFADQAVIAIENVRLFTALETRTQELTRSVGELRALGEVGQAISSTLDLETVLTTIVSRAVQLSVLDGGVVFEYDEETEEFVQRVATETGGALAEARRTTRVRKGEGVLGRTAITLEPAQVPDITVPGAYESRLRENLIASGIRAILAVPMVREDRLIGCLAVTRDHPGEFPPETIELLRTFATQSALAIQNARLFREIEEKSRQLEVASQHKSEFLANMSHELRTPLNAIIGFSEVLTERMFGELNEKQEEYLKDIYASGTHLLSLINDILDLSKIEAGRMELELTDFDLPTAIDNALTLVRERAGRRGVALEHSVDERLGEVRGDERKVKQVLLNLLSNALKFTPEGGRVEVRAGMVDGMAEISVTDTGVGIAPEDQGAIFEEFRQVGTADKKAEGTGLGLTLCRKFVELHGGKIWVKSEVGVGSTFTFSLPLRDS